MEAEFTVQVVVNDDIGTLQWSGATNQETLDRAVSLASDDTLIARGLRRLEVSIPATDRMAMTSLHRAGYRREGIRRQALKDGQGGYVDAVLYARLATDQVYGLGGFSGVMDTVLPMHRIMAHVLFRSESGDVLLVQTTYKDDWELPGGIIEPLESPRQGAIREVEEELGITVELGRPVLVDWLPPFEGWSDALEFLYDGGVLPADSEFELPADELVAWHWVPTSKLADVVSAQSHRRLTLLLAGGGPHFTRDGHAER